MASRFWVGGTGTWDGISTTHWSSISGGTGGASVPTSSDTVTFNGSSGSGVVTLSGNGIGLELIMTGYTGTLDCNGNFLRISSDVTLSSGMTAINLQFSMLSPGSFTSAGKTITNLNNVSGLTVLQDSLTSTGDLEFLGLTTNGFNITCGGSFRNDNGSAITLGSSLIIISGGNFYIGSSCTLSAGTSTIRLSGVGGSGIGLFINTTGLTFATVEFDNSGGATAWGLAGSASIDTLIIDPGITLHVSAGNTYTVNTFQMNGTAGNLVTVVSTSPGTPFTFTKSSGAVIADFISLTDSVATGGATFTAKHAVDGGGNSGWIFVKNSFLFSHAFPFA